MISLAGFWKASFKADRLFQIPERLVLLDARQLGKQLTRGCIHLVYSERSFKYDRDTIGVCG